MSMEQPEKINEEHAIFLSFCKAGNVDKVESLLAANKSLIDVVEAGGFGALHFAAAHGHKTLMQHLLKHKPAEIDLKNYDQNTPLALAAKCKQNELVEMLLDAGADVNKTSSTGVTAAHHAAFMGNLDTFQLLIKRGAKAGAFGEGTKQGTYLHWAASGGQLGMCQTLVYDYNVPIDSLDEYGGTPLKGALLAHNSEVMQFLLEHGADPNHKSKDGGTALHISCYGGTLDDTKLLLEFGADPTAKDRDGETPADAIKHSKTGKQEKHAHELVKPQLDAKKRLEDALRFKNHGNRVFAEGENNKANKFYTRAIALDRNNHVYFSNRSACNYNIGAFRSAFYDAKRCIALKPDWPKGYFRLAATEAAMKKFNDSAKTIEAGLKLDSKNSDLVTLKSSVQEELKKLAAVAAVASS